MKGLPKRIVSVVVALILIFSLFSVSAHADVSHESNIAIDDSLHSKFNLFTGCGPVFGDFADKTSAITKEYWNDNYISSIVMNLGENKLVVDGKEVVTTECAEIYNGELFLPIPEIISVLGGEVTIDETTGDYVVADTVNNENFDIQRTALRFAGKAEVYVEQFEFAEYEKTLNVESLTNQEKIVVLGDNTVIRGLGTNNALAYKPLIRKDQAETAFGLEIVKDNNSVIITKPFQMKELILFVKNGKNLTNTYGACEVITNEQGLYFLQYPTEQATKSAYELLKKDANIEFVIVNKVAKSHAIPGGSWGTDGNNNSMGIQASRMKNYLQENNNNEITVAVVDGGIDSTHTHLQN